MDLDSETQLKEAKTPQEYLENLPAARRGAVEKLRTVILENLPDGFEEVISYGMLGYVVPHTLYPAGYHVNPKEPLPFINLASQKQHIAFYHMGIYALPDLLAWFEKEYAARAESKLDMGKSCIRFKKPDAIPYDLIAELCRKITVEQYISLYEEGRKSQRR